MRISDWSSDVCSSDLTVVGDRGGSPLLLQDDVATLGTKRHLDGVGEGVHAPLETAARLFIESNQLRHNSCDSLMLRVWTESESCPRRTIRLTRRTLPADASDLNSPVPSIGRASCRERVCQYV